MKNDETDGVLTRYSELSKKNKELELDLEDTRKMRDILEMKFKSTSDDLTRIEIEREELNNKVNKLENEIKILKSQLGNSKKGFSDLEEKKDAEINILEREIESLRQKEREYSNKIVFMERDLDQHKDDNRRLKKELENTKADCDQMLKMMENFEAKVQHYQKKEEQMNRLSKESKEKVEEALLQRDRVLLKEEHYQKTIDNMTETHRQEVQALKDQYDRMLENMKSRNKMTIDSRESEAKGLGEEVMRLNSQLDKTQKQLKELRSENTRLNTALKEVNSKEEDKISEYERKISELEAKLLDKEQDYNEQLRGLKKEKASLEAASKGYSTSIPELKSTVETLRSQNMTLTSENQSLKSKLNTVQKDKATFLDEIASIKKNYETQIALYAEDYNNKIREFEDQMHDSVKKERTTREKTLELVRTHEKVNFVKIYEMLLLLIIFNFGYTNINKIEDKLKRELENNIRHYEKIIGDLKNENKYLSQRYIANR